MGQSNEDAKDVLSVCESVELACAKLYHYFAGVFKSDRESFLLWLKVAMEEENQARLFALLGKLRCDGMVESAEVRLAAAEATLGYVQSLIEKVETCPPSLVEALQMAIELQIRLDSFLQEHVIRYADHSCEKSFLSMTAAGSKHLELLREAHARCSVV